MLAGTVPFSNARALKLFSDGNARLPTEALSAKSVSIEATEFLSSLIVLGPSKRLKAETALKSAWFGDVVDAKLYKVEEGKSEEFEEDGSENVEGTKQKGKKLHV